MRWGTVAALQEFFGDGVSDLSVTRREHVFRFRSPEHWVEHFRAYYGPINRAFGALDSSGQEQLSNALQDLVRQNIREGSATAVWPSEYVEVVAVRA
jgi:hypothetical protein